MQNSKVKLACCIGVSRHEYFSFPFLAHFISHYLGLGIKPDDFLLTLSSPQHDGDIKQVEEFLSAFEIKPAKYLLGPYDCYRFYQSNFELMAQCSPEDWIVLIDFDELIEFPLPLPLFVKELNAKRLNAATGFLVDRLAPNGEFAEILPGIPIWEQFPLKLAITRDIVEGCHLKTCVFRNYLKASMGHHIIKHQKYSRPFPDLLKVHHFKWDSTLPKRIQRTRDQFRSNPGRYHWYHEVDNLMRHIDGSRLRYESAQIID